MKKRLLSLFLTFSMLLTFFPVSTVTVFAEDTKTIDSLKIAYQKSETGYSAITSTS